MKADDIRLSTYDLRQTFKIDPDAPWPRPGEVTAIIATAVAPAAMPRAAVDPRHRAASRRATSIRRSRSPASSPDAICSANCPMRPARAATISCCARPTRRSGSPTCGRAEGRHGKDFELGLDARIDTGRWLTVRGTVQQVRGLLVLDAEAGSLALAQAADRDDDRGGTDPRAGRAAAGSRLQRADAGRDRRPADDDRADSVFARPRSGDAEGTDQAALPRVAERRARRAGDAAGRVHVPVHAGATACSRSSSRSRSSASAR